MQLPQLRPLTWFALVFGTVLFGCSEGEQQGGVDAGGIEQEEVPCPDDLPVFEPGLSQLGTQGLISAQLVAADPSTPQKGFNDWTVAFFDATGAPLADVEVMEATTFMVVHNHPGNFEPTPSALAEPGQWLLDGIHFSMRGPWETRILVRSPTVGDDRIVMNVCVGQ